MKVYKLLFLIVLMAGLQACSSKKTDIAQEKNSENGLEADPRLFDLGDAPQVPIKNFDGNPKPILGLKIFDENSSNAQNQQFVSDSLNSISVSGVVSILSSSSILLTVWALRPGNWIWGYPPLKTSDLQNLMEWRIEINSQGYVAIKNEQTKTCLTGYKNGVIHTSCDNSMAQQWNIRRFNNGAVQFQNVASGKCLQTPFTESTPFHNIYQTQCATTQPNLDQQWFIIPGFKFLHHVVIPRK